MITGAAFLLFVVGVLVYVVILGNELVRLRNDNDRAWANIDVPLVASVTHDEIPNLVETVKGYMAARAANTGGGHASADWHP